MDACRASAPSTALVPPSRVETGEVRAYVRTNASVWCSRDLQRMPRMSYRDYPDSRPYDDRDIYGPGVYGALVETSRTGRALDG